MFLPVKQTQPVTYTVSRISKSGTVAGAIAARAREGIGPVLEAIGEVSVCNAVLAICRTRLYLENDKLDVRFVAVSETVEKESSSGDERGRRKGGGVTVVDSIMKMRLFLEDVE